MSKSFSAFGLAVSAIVLTTLPAAAQTKVTNEGVTPTEIVIGTHQDLSGPIKGWGVPVANGMKMAAEEINAAGGINGRKLKLIVEDSAYDPKKAVLASQKLIGATRSSPWSARWARPPCSRHRTSCSTPACSSCFR